MQLEQSPKLEMEYSEHFKAVIERHSALLYKMADNLLQDLIDDPERIKLGEGQIAKVFTIGHKTKPCCIKIIKKSEDRRHVQQNYDINREFDFQLQLANHDIDGVSVPRPYAKATLPQHSIEFFIMERVNGVSLQDVMDRGADLPEGFNLELFFDKLEKFMNDMNENKHIYHRDFHSGNVMVDMNGNPWVIDFGAANHIVGDDPLQEENPDSSIIKHMSDVARLNRMRIDMRKYLTNLEK